MVKETDIIQTRELCFGLLTVCKLRSEKAVLKVSWGKLSIALVSLVVLSWITLFTGVYFLFKYQKQYNEVSYLETLVLPFDRKGFQTKRGEYYIQTGLDALEEGDLKTAVNMLRNGLLRAPHHLEARLTLADFYEFLFNRPDLASKVLEEGVMHLEGLNPLQTTEFLTKTFSVASRNQLDREILSISEKIITSLDEPLNLGQRVLIAYQSATAHRNLGNYEKSKEFIEEHDLKNYPEGLVLHAQLLWDRGLEEEAIQALETNLHTFQQNQSIYEKLVFFHQEKNQISRARQYGFLFRISHSELFASHLSYLSHFYEFENDPEKINLGIDEYLDKFSSDPTALRQLAILASKYGDTPSVAKILENVHTRSPKQNPLLSQFIIIESEIRAKNYTNALAAIKRLESEYDEKNPMNPDSKTIFLSLKTATFHGLDRAIEAEKELEELLRSSIIKMDRFLAVAYLFLDVNAPSIAKKILERCKESHPNNQNLLEASIATQLKAKDAESLAQSLDQAMSQRRLPNQLLIGSYQLLESDTFSYIPERISLLGKIASHFEDEYLFRVKTRS
ncbi:MAG: tetratricopeptide repeat protein [Opitutales bacterium]|nr:tetratricopeptide repeat protein [Opitutales bacterium]